MLYSKIKITLAIIEKRMLLLFEDCIISCNSLLVHGFVQGIIQQYSLRLSVSSRLIWRWLRLMVDCCKQMA